MKFHQGYFGATSSGHDLLACAPEQRERFLRILDRTDVQGILPTGTAFDTYVTAFRVEQDFVLMRTSVDENATRAGMVFSHALIANASELVDTPSLHAILQKLRLVKPDCLDVDEVEFTPNPDYSETEVKPSAALINALVAGGTRPPIWRDRGDFIDAIAAVWRNAWPELRSLLTFTMGLSPEDAHLSEYALLYVPEAMIGRWSGFHVISQAESSSVTEAGASALAGGPASRKLREIAQQVSWPPTTLTALKDLADLHERVAYDGTSPREDIRALRLLCFAAASPLVAVDLKSLVLTRTISKFAKASLGDLLACRNLVLSCLPDQTVFWSEIGKRVSTLFKAEYTSKVRSEYIDFLLRLGAEKPSSWRDYVVDGIRGALAISSATMATEIIAWIAEDSALASLVFSLVPQTEQWESSLTRALPTSMSQESVDATLAALAPGTFVNVRAECLAAYLSADDAFDWELNHGVEVSALPALASRYSPSIIVSQAVRTEDSRLLPMVAASVESDSKLLLSANLDQPIWRSIIRETRGRRLKVARGAEFSRMQTQMVELMRAKDGDAALFSALRGLGFFDLSRYSTDPNIWDLIPDSLREDFVEDSIVGAIASLGRGEVPFRDLAEPLKRPLQDPKAAMALLERLELHLQISMFGMLPVFSQVDFRRWYSTLMMREKGLSTELVKGIGASIASRGWRDAAEQVANDYLNYRRFDLKGCLNAIKPLLGPVTRFRLMLSGAGMTTSDFGSDDLWEQLELVLVERFTQGPREHGLWDKSKGHDGDLLIGGSAREQWHHALGLIRGERHHAPKLKRLLEEARKVHGDQHLTWFHHNWRELVKDTKGH